MDVFSYLLGKSKGTGGGITPVGTINITENGTYDVTNYASAEVETPTPRDWSQIGYTSEPSFIDAGFQYAKTIKDNYVETTDWQAKFENDTQLIFAPLIDTSNVTNMWSTFSNCSNLLTVPNYDTSNVTSMRAMFQVCLHLNNFKPSFDTSNVTSMMYMFRRCYGLQKIDLTSFDTSKVDTMKEMFNNCEYLEEADLSSFTSDVLTDASTMFAYCKSLKRLDMRAFDFTVLSTATSRNNMFGASATYGPPDNCLIIVKDASQKSWFSTYFSRFTNVRTPEEL